ncbi:hypothetical protein GE09DRAFT_1090879 [Coniochaeta sp. 2T2.1]|nr:hypothetical protein GE09DRAFT_1090879 [Coniochaeta sp. 2T2.1]
MARQPSLFGLLFLSCIFLLEQHFEGPTRTSTRKLFKPHLVTTTTWSPQLLGHHNYHEVLLDFHVHRGLAACIHGVSVCWSSHRH